MTNQDLSNTLALLAQHIESAPARLVGASISVTGGGGGSATGLRISVGAGAPGTKVVGMSVSVSEGDYHSQAAELIKDLREAAEAAKNSKPPKSWIYGLLDRAKNLGNRAIETGVLTASAKIAEHYTS